jgi:hypothetical protein
VICVRLKVNFSDFELCNVRRMPQFVKLFEV